MSRLIKIILVLSVLGLGWIIVQLWRAPVGYEDDKGFHKK
jgi:hypothetical protein